jgi:hypothetical protein
MSDSSALTLSEVLKAGDSKAKRLQEFIRQEEARGIGPANVADLEIAIKLLATQPRSKDQT